MMAAEIAVADKTASCPSKEIGLNTRTRITAHTIPPVRTLHSTNSTGDGHGVRLATDRSRLTPAKMPHRMVRWES